MTRQNVMRNCIALALLLFFAYLALSSRVAERQPSYPVVKMPPKQVAKLWLGNSFTQIDEAAEFQSSIGKAVHAALKEHIALSDREESVTSLLTKFIYAYSQGDFAKFLAFRSPAGSLEPKVQSLMALKDYLEQQGLTLSSSNDFRRKEVMLDILHTYWKHVEKELSPNLSAVGTTDSISSGLPSISTKGETSKKSKAPRVVVCTRCLSSIALSSIRVIPLSDTGANPDITPQVAAKPNMGLYAIRGSVNATPTPDSIRKNTAKPLEFIAVEAVFKLNTGFAHPVHVVATWYDEQRCYIPIAIHTPVSGPQGARFPF